MAVGFNRKRNATRAINPPEEIPAYSMRLESQPMDSALFDRLPGEEHRETAAVIPGVELVFVKGTQKISGLAEREVLDGSVEVGKIHVHAHGRPMSSGCRLDGIRCARLGIGPDIEKPGEERKPRRDAVVKRKLDRLAPLPGRVVARTYKSRNPPHGVIETLHQRGIKVRAAGRKPARPAVLEDIFEKDRAQAPMIDRNVVREFWPQDAFEECLPRELKHQRRT